MSRCFPYPPPGYSRNGATYEALIESIKLQKETEKAKAERKKEKKEKKDKDKRKDKEKGKANEKPTSCPVDVHKGSKGRIDFKDANGKRTEPRLEHLEMSDLTEEHGQPVDSQKQSYSSDSTQNSNKRKREDDASSTSRAGGQGKTIKIRLLKKHKGPESEKETICSTSGRTDLSTPCVADARAKTLPPSSSLKRNSSAPSAPNSVVPVQGLHSRDKTTLVTKNGLSGAGQGYNSIGVHSTQRQKGAVESLHFNEGGRLGSGAGVPSIHSTEKQPTPALGRLALPPSQVKDGRLGSNAAGVQSLPFTEKQSTPVSGRLVVPPSRLDTGRLNPSVGGSELPCPSSVQGVHLGEKQPSAEMRTHAKVAPPKPTKKERKMQKKQKKYEKLFGGWVPPVLLAELPEDSDEDWLFGKKEPSSKREDKTSAPSCNDIEMTCRESAASSSLWRPCAQYMPEADIYALPYTIPF